MQELGRVGRELNFTIGGVEAGGMRVPEADVDELVARYDRCFDACDFEEAARGFELCRELYAEAGNLRGEAYVLHRLAQVASRTGRLPEAKRLYVEAIDRHRAAGQIRGVADVTHSLADVERQLGNADAARELYQQAASLFREVGEVHSLVEVLTSLGDFEASFGLPGAPAARTWYEQALSLARDDGEIGRLPTVLVSLAEVCRVAGDAGQAKRLYLEAEGLAARADSFEALGDASRGRAMLDWTEGHLSAAWEAMVKAIRAYEEQPNVAMQVESLNLRGEIELALGDGDSARRTFASADRIAVKAGVQHGRVHALAGLGREASARGDAAGAVEYLERALEAARGLHLPIYEATVLADLGLARRRIDARAAEQTLDEALRRFEALGLVDEIRWLREERVKE